MGNIVDLEQYRSKKLQDSHLGGAAQNKRRPAQRRAKKTQSGPSNPVVGLLQHVRFTDGTVQILIDGIYLSDHAAAMAAAIQLAEFTRSRFSAND